MNNSNSDYIQKISIKPNFMTSYLEYIGKKYREKNLNSMYNLHDNKNTGDLSGKAIKRLYNAMDWLLLIAKNKQCENLKTGSFFDFKLNMTTLTLPAAQMHDDLYIKKNMLNEFLTILRKKHHLQNYIWKAEKQHNGNIHFHIVTDRYIWYKDINKYWNNILTTHKYIEKYRDNQKKYHINGFRFNKKAEKNWSKQNQLAAFKIGVNTNWSNPSSTTDIHSMKKIKSARAYIGKYLTKNVDIEKKVNQEIINYCEKNNIEDITSCEIDSIRDNIKNRMSVKGNIWYISQSLSKLKGAICYTSNAICDNMHTITKNFKDKITEHPYCCVYNLTIFDLIKHGLTALVAEFKNYIIDLRQTFYPPGTSDLYPLGVPLPIFDTM